MPDIFACADPWLWWLAACYPGTSTRYSSRRCAARCMVRMGSACVRLMLCERVRTGCLSGPGETPALGLHAHMAYASVRTRRMGFGDFGFPWEGN